MRRVLAATIVVLAGLVGGCGDDADRPATGGDTGSVRGRTFLAESVTEQGRPRPLVAGTRIRLTFHDDERLSASAGCNTMGGPAALESGRLVIGDLATTEMDCDAARHQQDEWLGGLLTAGPAYNLDSDRLTITRGDTVVTLVAEP